LNRHPPSIIASNSADPLFRNFAPSYSVLVTVRHPPFLFLDLSYPVSHRRASYQYRDLCLALHTVPTYTKGEQRVVTCVRACVRFGKSSATQRNAGKKKDTRSFSHRLVPLPCRNRLSFVPGEACRNPGSESIHPPPPRGCTFRPNHHQHKKKQKTPPLDSPHTFARATGVLSFCALGRAIYS
jgi:hypothetical protein